MIFDDEGQKKLILGLINNSTFNGAKVKEAAAFIHQVETAEVIPFEEQMPFIKGREHKETEANNEKQEEAHANNNGG